MFFATSFPFIRLFNRYSEQFFSCSCSLELYVEWNWLHSTLLRTSLNWLCFFVSQRPACCHMFLSYKSLRQFASRQIGFVFSKSVFQPPAVLGANWDWVWLGLFSPSVQLLLFVISSCFEIICIYLLFPKLALFFQLGFQPPAQVWGLIEIGFDWVCFLLPKTVKNHQNLCKSLSILT